MSWNDNLQNNCLEQKFAKKMSGTTIPKNMARTTTDKKKDGQDNNLQKKLYRTTIYKKKSARTKVCRKRCPEHQFVKSWTERLFAKNKLSRTTVCRICKKNDLSTAGRFGVHLVREISPWSCQVLCIGLVKT